MTAHLLRIAALSAALSAAPALAKSHKHAKHHAVRKHPPVASRTTRSRRAEVARADSAPAPAATTTATPATDDLGEAAPAGGRHVVTHSVYGAGADKAQ